MFCNLTSPEVISGNIIAAISDHLPQFLIALKIFANPSSNKSNIFERNWSNFNQENFILNCFSSDLKAFLKIVQQNTSFSLETCKQNQLPP